MRTVRVVVAVLLMLSLILSGFGGAELQVAKAAISTTMSYYPLYIASQGDGTVTGGMSPFALYVRFSGAAANASTLHLKAYSPTSSASYLFNWSGANGWLGPSGSWSSYANFTSDASGAGGAWIYAMLPGGHTGSTTLLVGTRDSSNHYSPAANIVALDMTAGTGTGGWIAGVAYLADEVTPAQNAIVVVRDSSNNIVGTYATEDNTVSEGYAATAGAFRVAVPVGTGYSVEIWDPATNAILGAATAGIAVAAGATTSGIAVNHPLPGAPAGLSAVDGYGEISLSWTAPLCSGNAPVDGYNVYRGASAGSIGTTPLNGGTLITGAAYTDTALGAGAHWFYVAKAHNSLGESDASAVAEAWTFNVPSAVTTLTAVPGNGKVDLSWSASTADPQGKSAIGYNLWRGTTAGGEDATTPINGATPITGTSYSDTSVTNTVKYYYVVTAVNEVGQTALNSGNEADATPSAALGVMTVSPLPDATVGVSYAETLTAAGGVPPYTWSATGIPEGLALSSDGVLSGIPAAAGTSTIQATVTDSVLAAVSTDLQITVAAGAPADGSSLLLGNPSDAVHDSATSPDNYLMDSGYYTLSYNSDRGEPNWVSWYLGNSSLGSAPRQDDYRADTSLPAGWYQVQNTSYSGSGFDRGHNCPSGDRTSSVTANSSTFLMTNMIPQAPNNNERTWDNFENYLRSLVTGQNDEVYVVMGSYGAGGTGSNGTAMTVDAGHVAVPAHIWKVAVVLPAGDNDLSRITAATRVIAIDTPNTNTIDADWQKYLTSVDAIEAATGYDLLSNVDPAVQSILEARTDAGQLVIKTASLPAATVGVPYSTTLSAAGGTPPYAWSATAGLPAGLTLSSNGTLSGTPTVAGNVNVGMTVTDSGSPAQSVSGSLPLTVASALPPAAVTIATARGTPNSSGVPSTKSQTFTVEGIVTFVVGSKEAYIQDATGGIDVYGTMPAGVTLVQGDKVLVTGTITQYNGLTEIGTTAVTVESHNNPLPAALSMTTAQANGETCEGSLVALAGTLAVAASPAPGTSQFTVTDGTSSLLIYLKGWSLPSALVAGTELSLARGILSQYDSSSPYTSGYELLARSSSDIVVLRKHTIMVSAGNHGSVAPAGAVSVVDSADAVFSMTADRGYVIDQLLVDGSKVLSAAGRGTASYTFSSVACDHVLSVTFRPAQTGVPSLSFADIDGQSGWTVSGGIPSAVTGSPAWLCAFRAHADTGAVVITAVADGRLLAQTVADGDGSMMVPLDEGINHVTITAVSSTGATASRSFSITVDTHGPQIVLAPSLPASTSGSSIEVRGTAVDSLSGVSGVTINGSPVACYVDGSFDETIVLSAGINTIDVGARDGAGNVTEQRFTITRQSAGAAGTGAGRLVILNIAIGSTAMDEQGSPVALDAAPFLRAGRTFLPVRAVIEALGGNVMWHGAAQTTVITLRGRTVVLTVGRNVATVDGKTVSIDPDRSIVPVIVRGRVFLPLRFVADALGIETGWDAASRVVTLSFWP